ncbi:hypothetical protein PV328_001430 [Microctonus aethiopoides]|uniref:Uncharacterized protein n=1 Tax=Microctonus aethiopoides TaxID=144406 RepID=A0AA39KXA9_9HYME|nr:hypothetical protein PV328_001430 [Microctonus aethiopoides]
MLGDRKGKSIIAVNACASHFDRPTMTEVTPGRTARAILNKTLSSNKLAWWQHQRSLIVEPMTRSRDLLTPPKPVSASHQRKLRFRGKRNRRRRRRFLATAVLGDLGEADGGCVISAGGASDVSECACEEYGGVLSTLKRS